MYVNDAKYISKFVKDSHILWRLKGWRAFIWSHKSWSWLGNNNTPGFIDSNSRLIRVQHPGHVITRSHKTSIQASQASQKCQIFLFLFCPRLPSHGCHTKSLSPECSRPQVSHLDIWWILLASNTSSTQKIPKANVHSMLRTFVNVDGKLDSSASLQGDS